MAFGEKVHLVIHVGPHKTGTTSIQKMLLSQSSKEDCGFTYPLLCGDEIGQHTFAQSVCSPERPACQRMLAVLKTVEGLCVLSSEELCYLPAAGIRSLRDALPDARVTIAYYQRDILSLLQSWWQETVKHGSVRTLPDFAFGCVLAPSQLHLLVPDTLLKGWASVFGRDAIRIVRYDHVSDVAKQFASDFLALDLPAEALAFSNLSYDYIDCEMMRFWNRQGFWGSGVVQAPDYLDVRTEFAERSSAFTRNFSLNYSRSAFSTIEEMLISRWGDRIEGFDGGQLFEVRERLYSYIDPDVWAAHPALIDKMRAFALQNAAFSCPKR
ncbi:hypothetical protein ACLBX9_18515 [Methylobacterium sp. A49B]